MWEIRDQYIIDDTDGQVICCWGSYTTRRKAQLIAAAPAMLDALRITTRVLEEVLPTLTDESDRETVASAIGEGRKAIK